LNISAELIDARDDSHIWGQQYSRKASDILALQSDITREITTALRTRLTGEDEKRMAKVYTASPDAYKFYLQGLYWRNKRSDISLAKAITYFRQAIENDPRYALAYSALADSYSLSANNLYASPNDTYPRAREASLKALEIDDNLAEAHVSLAFVRALYDWDWSAADTEYRRAFQLNPDYAYGHETYGNVLRISGRMGEAIAQERRGIEIDPLSLATNRGLGYALYDARQNDEAIDQERKTLELDPNYNLARSILGRAYLQKAMFNEGITEFQRIISISPKSTTALSDLGFAYALAGMKSETQKVVEQLIALSAVEYLAPKNVAVVYAALGEKDKAFGWLEKSYDDRSLASGQGLKGFPGFDPLRSDPRFADLLLRMNLQP
jgi:tetratricopeptide (TPR) repeat protein